MQDEIIPVVRANLPLFPYEAIRITLKKAIFKQLPLWAIVSFGAYLLFKLGLGVFTFNDVPDAHKELLKDIDMAREELKAKGIDVD